MDNLASRKKSLNKQQTALRTIMTSFNNHEEAIRKFLNHHACLHSIKVVEAEKDISHIWSYEDAILNDLDKDQIRTIPTNSEHSIAWCIWHLARIEDIALNVLVAGTPQVYLKDNWIHRLNVEYIDSGNEMDRKDISRLSEQIDTNALRSYRVAVGFRTREIARGLQPPQLKTKVDPTRIQQVKEQGALVEAAYAIAAYWSRRNIAGLLLMPATRHNLVHLNEASRIKDRMKGK
jgi:hypothetical protein